jgi:hypothetical protein
MVVIMKLKDEEMYNVEGGAIKNWKYGIFLGVAGLITLIVGIIDGYMNPQKCNS